MEIQKFSEEKQKLQKNNQMEILKQKNPIEIIQYEEQRGKKKEQ